MLLEELESRFQIIDHSIERKRCDGFSIPAHPARLVRFVRPPGRFPRAACAAQSREKIGCKSDESFGCKTPRHIANVFVETTILVNNDHAPALARGFRLDEIAGHLELA